MYDFFTTEKRKFGFLYTSFKKQTKLYVLTNKSVKKTNERNECFL